MSIEHRYFCDGCEKEIATGDGGRFLGARVSFNAVVTPSSATPLEELMHAQPVQRDYHACANVVCVRDVLSRVGVQYEGDVKEAAARLLADRERERKLAAEAEAAKVRNALVRDAKQPKPEPEAPPADAVVIEGSPTTKRGKSK